MIMLRIPIAQPPNATRNSEKKGRNQWCSRTRMKPNDQVRCEVGS